ncbi:prenyltransferase/squalene oxidase repeat-containing protein [Pontiella sp.]|uniref:prenyltransferase/squalene oxidase repeat-containing protein n=1 Tax=Pontiella sp. TaxID=2837462 RepID=UPI00356B3D38
MGIDNAIQNARARLLAELTPQGRWEGELSSSALATAVAAFALKSAGKTELAERGLQWLRDHRNADGGWGDSPESPSNFTTTLLCRCALDLETGDPEKLAAEILRFYGADRTFSVPILTMCMLAGKLGDDWAAVPQLPFELAVFPHKLYRFLNLPVVSYALPALIAIGLVRHAHKPAPLACYRNGLVARVLAILRSIQPESGGFLEAAPLTGFVAMSLVGAGQGDHPVAKNCIRFLEETVRAEGCWPIDINLSSWVTALAVRALDGDLSDEQRDALRNHLVKTQWQEEHPFTHAEPGGWGWTNHQGGVPDADDTAAALIALHQLGCDTAIAERGILWLLQLQNRDGGMPTFCKGWGKLPFDRSCPDLTAHMIRAFALWRDDVDENLWAAMFDSILTGVAYLEKQQRPDGSWVPLWFGSQSNPDRENPVYGTCRVLEALTGLDEKQFPQVGPMKQRAFRWLEHLPPDGLGIEELALWTGMTGKGVDVLLEKTAEGTRFPASPIGLYFASLWYSEKLYPLIFSVEALKRCRKNDE